MSFSLRYYLFTIIILFQINLSRGEISKRNLMVSNKDPEKLRKDLLNLISSFRGRVGFSARVLESGDFLEIHGKDRYPMQSTYKFPIALYVLHEVDQGKWKMDQKIKIRPEEILKNLYGKVKEILPNGGEMKVSDLISYMIMESDNTACDILIDRMGGCKTINEWVHSWGIQGIQIKTNERIQQSDNKNQYQNWANPGAFISLLKILSEGKLLSKVNSEFLLNLMAKTMTGPKRIRAGLPPGTYLAHKTGSSGTDQGLTFATNDVGIIKLPNGNHLLISILVSDSSESIEEIEGIMAQITRITWEFYR